MLYCFVGLGDFGDKPLNSIKEAIMKQMKKFIVVIMLACSALFMQGCYGSFPLFNKILSWNGTIGNKWVNTLVYVCFWIIPVYEIALLADWWVINAIEFWSGSNPLAMHEGESETQIVSVEGERYQITATKNRFDIIRLDGELGEPVSLVYDPETTYWRVEQGEISQNLFAMSGDGKHFKWRDKEGRDHDIVMKPE